MIENTNLGKNLRWSTYDIKKPRNYSPSYFKQEIPAKFEQVRYANIYETNSEPLLMPVAPHPVLNDPKKDITSKDTDEEFLPPINEEISREEEVEEFLPMDKYEVVDATQNLEEEEFLPMNEESVLYEKFSPNVHESLLDSNQVIKRRYIESDRNIPQNRNDEIYYIEEDAEEYFVPINEDNRNKIVNPIDEDSEYTIYNKYDINEEFVPTRYVDPNLNTSYVIEEEEDEEGENLPTEKAYDGVITVYEDENGNTFVPKSIYEYEEYEDDSYIPDSRFNLNKDDDGGDDFIPARRCEEIVSTRYLKDANQEITPQAYEEDETENYEDKRFIRLHPVIGSNN